MRAAFRRWSIATFVSVVAWPATQALADPADACLEEANRVANPSAETAAGDWPESWFHSATGVVWDATQFVSGTHSFKLDDTSASSSADWRSSEFDVTPGETLTLSLYYHTVSISGGEVLVHLRFFDDLGFLEEFTGAISETTTGFTYAEIRGTVPADAKRADVVMASQDPVVLTETYFDDVKVDGNLIPNGRAERIGEDGWPLDWYKSGSFTSLVASPDAPSPGHVLQLDDTSASSPGDWRSQSFDVTRYSSIGFCAWVRRTGDVGTPAALIRFFDQLGFIGESAVALTDTSGAWQRVNAQIGVPENAISCDVVLTTWMDPAIVTLLQFDDVSVVPLALRQLTGACCLADESCSELTEAACLNAHILHLGPANPGAENGTTNWHRGSSPPNSWTELGAGTGVDSSISFNIGASATGVGADWRSDQFSLGAAAGGAIPIEFSFQYRLNGAVPAGQNIRIDFRFWNSSGGFAGEQNIFVGADSGDSSMTEYKLFSRPDIIAPASALTADIRVSVNLFTTWSAGGADFDDFAVTIPNPDIPVPGVFHGTGTTCEETSCSLLNCNQPAADTDGDGDVDMADFAFLQRCLTTGGTLLIDAPEYCQCLDYNEDEAIDLLDVDAFIFCASGPEIDANPNCGQMPQ